VHPHTSPLNTSYFLWSRGLPFCCGLLQPDTFSECPKRKRLQSKDAWWKCARWKSGAGQALFSEPARKAEQGGSGTAFALRAALEAERPEPGDTAAPGAV